MRKSGFVPDNTNIKKTSGTPNLFFDSKDSVFFEKNPNNIAYKVTSTQLPAMVSGAFVDLYLTRGNIREPHWHPNSWELDVVVSGEAVISIVNPNTQTLHNYRAKPGQVVFIPMAWWHWIRPLSEKLHLHLFFNNDQFETAEGSDMLRLTPPEVFQLAYGINSEKMADTLSLIKESIVVGPPTKDNRETRNHLTLHPNDFKSESFIKKKHEDEEISININNKAINI